MEFVALLMRLYHDHGLGYSHQFGLTAVRDMLPRSRDHDGASCSNAQPLQLFFLYYYNVTVTPGIMRMIRISLLTFRIFT